MDREKEIQQQFLDEAQEYIQILETVLIGISQRIETDPINAALRSTHSIKGGAAMMGFTRLSHYAHRLEDSLKVLKIQRNAVNPDITLEQQLLAAVDGLRQICELERQERSIGADLQTQIDALLDQLHQRLGEPQAEDAYSILAPEEGQDIVLLLFQTEVEASLSQLEAILSSAAILSAEDGGSEPLLPFLAQLTDELGGLGEMLQLPAFVQLCRSVQQHLLAASEPVGQVERIATAALQAWRRSQALILTGHRSELPDAITLPGITPVSFAASLLESQPAPVSAASEAIDANESAPTAPIAEETTRIPTTNPDALVLPATSSVETSLTEAKLNPQPDLVENTVRVPVKQLDRLNDLCGELTIERNGLDLSLKRLRKLMKGLSQRIQVLETSNTELRDAYDQVAPLDTGSMQSSMPQRSHPLCRSVGLHLEPHLRFNPPSPDRLTASAQPFNGLDSGFDALELDRYDNLHLLSQEVMESIVQIQEIASDLEIGLDEAEQTTRELNRTARQLQTRLTQVRMRPLSDLTDRFPRALRDLSLQYGKPVRLQVQGANTLIDRNILDALNEPLLHLVRNAFDHGIEPPELRQQHGKPPEGTITIRASHQPSRTLITLSDDGGGIPLDKIRDRARQMGLDEVLLAAASDQELLSLIFEPGFSTCDQVTALSGRGIGMDVVRDRLRQIQGEITVNTQAGQGTTFTLSVPLTLSVMRVLLAESNGLLMAFPTRAIQEMVIPDPSQIMTTAGSEAFAWNGSMVQLIRLKQWLTFNGSRSLDTPEGTAAIGVPTVLLLTQGDQLIGLEVDRCWGEQEVAIRKIQGGPSLPAGFSNCTILGDGRVVPLVSIPDLWRWLITCQRALTDFSHPALAPVVIRTDPRSIAALPRTRHTVLIIDDSTNVRRFLALTLEKAGYQVIQAKDGQEALDKLATGLAVQAVVCDIEMPRLDGYGFLARLKSNPSYEQLPVAMLTTRSSDKHRQLALSLGATAYFSKPFNEQNLLQALDQMVA
ncbi:MAG: response regulator [Elainella sp. Prado103]|nr:response regulator [Elainella sp. Prado103]